jgi:putative aminopeptidase FrvX
VPEVTISCTPSRYIHKPVTVMKMGDLEKSAELIVKAVESVYRFF